MFTPFNPDAPTQEYPEQRRGPPIRKVEPAPRWVDTNGFEHASYAEAYQASVLERMTKIIMKFRSDGYIGPRVPNQAIARAIMEELTVSWP